MSSQGKCQLFVPERTFNFLNSPLAFYDSTQYNNNFGPKKLHKSAEYNFKIHQGVFKLHSI